MREYGQIQSSFWTDPEIQGLSDHAIRLACYLLTGPHTSSLGCFRLPNGYVQEDFQWGSERVSKGFQELLGIGFIKRCESTSWVLVPNFLRWNPVSNPNVAKKLEKDFKIIPKNISIYNDLIDSIERYGKHFSEGFLNGFERVPESDLKPYRNKDPDPDPDPDPNKNIVGQQENSDEDGNETLPIDPEDQQPVPPKTARSSLRRDAESVLEFLNSKCGRQYRPTDANLEIIIARLKEGYRDTDLTRVIIDRFNRWNHDDKFREYLRPKTLFNKTNFSNYVGDLPPALRGDE